MDKGKLDNIFCFSAEMIIVSATLGLSGKLYSFKRDFAIDTWSNLVFVYEGSLTALSLILLGLRLLLFLIGSFKVSSIEGNNPLNSSEILKIFFLPFLSLFINRS